MNFPTNILKNPFYFIKDEIVYEISEKQDKDGCGRHFVAYVTKEIRVKKGDTYLDANGTQVVAHADGQYEASTKALDLEPTSTNFTRFPWICVEYKETTDSERTKKEYLWLDYLIKDSDSYDEVKFHINEDHYDGKDEPSYVGQYKHQLEEMVKAYVKNGYSMDEIKKQLPYYITASENDPIMVNGKKVYFVSLTDSEGGILAMTGEDLTNYMYEAYKEMVQAYADRLLAKVNPDVKACVKLPCNEDEEQDGKTMTEEEIAQNIQLLLHNNGMLANAIADVQADLESGFDNIDPINNEILSESNLMLYSNTVNNSVETYGSLVKVTGEETVDQAKEAFRQDLVDTLITKYNPIFNYMCYSDDNKTNLVSVGTFVVNDYETVEHEIEGETENESTTYYGIRILGNSTATNGLVGHDYSNEINTIVWGNNPSIPKYSIRENGNNGEEGLSVNNMYYIESNNIESGATLELFVKQEQEFVSTGMFVEIYVNNTLQGTNNNISRKPKPKGKPQTDVKLTPHEEILVNQLMGAGKIERTWTVYADGCMYLFIQFESGKVMVVKNCAYMDN